MSCRSIRKRRHLQPQLRGPQLRGTIVHATIGGVDVTESIRSGWYIDGEHREYVDAAKRVGIGGAS